MAGNDSFRVSSEAAVYSRFLQVQNRQVVYPDGRKIDFDIVGHVRH